MAAIAIMVYTGNYVLAAEMGLGASMDVMAAGGALSGAISSGTAKGALWGAFSAMAFYGVGELFKTGAWSQMSKGGMMGLSEASTSLAATSLAHGVVGGVMGALQGNKFGSSFLSAGLTQFASGKLNLNASSPDIKMSNVLKAAMVGGTVSKITGGKFASAALTSAFANVVGQVADQQQMDKRMADAAYGNRDEWVAMEWPSIPQPVVDFSAGVGDSLTFGATRYGREALGISGGIGENSDYYTAGEYGAFLVGGARVMYGLGAKGIQFMALSKGGWEGAYYAVGSRNALKIAFRAGIDTKSRIYGVSEAFGRAGGNPSAIIQAAGSTNASINTVGAMGGFGGAANIQCTNSQSGC